MTRPVVTELPEPGHIAWSHKGYILCSVRVPTCAYKLTLLHDNPPRSQGNFPKVYF